jgi:uncharacterized protein YeaO (DUF488 family)
MPSTSIRVRRVYDEPESGERTRVLVELARSGPLTLLFGANDAERNQAIVLREVPEKMC